MLLAELDAVSDRAGCEPDGIAPLIPREGPHWRDRETNLEQSAARTGSRAAAPVGSPVHLDADGSSWCSPHTVRCRQAKEAAAAPACGNTHRPNSTYCGGHSPLWEYKHRHDEPPAITASWTVLPNRTRLAGGVACLTECSLTGDCGGEQAGLWKFQSCRRHVRREARCFRSSVSVNKQMKMWFLYRKKCIALTRQVLGRAPGLAP